ncbi:truncated transposase [Mycobacterium tuberculosis]|nr:truncated transposase [Mycobacterium tuberculosis]
MTSSHLIDAEQLLADQLAQASPDLLRGLLSTFIAALMGAEADALCGAGYRERSDERSNQRNGYRHRDFDTRAATIDVAIPKLRQGSYFPDWLLQRRKRAERALTSVVATCYLLGVSTRRMERLVETLGVTKLSKSQVSIMAKELDEAVEAFRTRPLDAGPYTFLAADALVLKEIVLYCKSGIRSAQALTTLKAAGLHNVKHLDGGIAEWTRTIDSSLLVY